MLWSADPVLAARADATGIDRIGLDLETLGKAPRQQGLRTFVSPHRIEALAAMRRAVTRGERLAWWRRRSAAEFDAARASLAARFDAAARAEPIGATP
jgi:hypothetical protein